jgi:hypothetical protein
VISGRGGVYIKYRIHEQIPYSPPKLLKEIDQGYPFEVVEDGKTVVVEKGWVIDLCSEFEHSGTVEPQTLTEAQRSALADAKVALVQDASYLIEESVFEEGDEVRVFGRVRVKVDPRGESESLRGQPIRRAFRSMWAEPVILMRVSDTSARG